MIKPDSTPEVIHKPTVFAFLQGYIKDHFPQFSVVTNQSTLFISGKLEDSDWGKSYEFLISSELTKPPTTFIMSPDIKPSAVIHMYPNGSLCLYHPKDLSRGYRFLFVKDIIPWMIKWVHYYEIWLRNGHIWIGPEAPHGL